MEGRIKIPNETRQGILNKCNDKCAYCGGELDIKSLVVEHEKPLCRGGNNDIYNLLPSCAFCNHKKGSKTSFEFWDYLSRTFDKDWISRAACNYPLFSYEHGKYILHFFWEYDWCMRIITEQRGINDNG